MFIEWILLAVIGVSGLIIGGFLSALRMRSKIKQIGTVHQSKLLQLTTDHDSRVNRLKKESQEHVKYAHHDFVKDLLPVLDALDEAVNMSTQQHDDNVQQGVQLLKTQIEALLTKYAIQPIAPQPGEAFDPDMHEAIAVVENVDLHNGAIHRCLRPGYSHDSRLLRAALVEVVKSV